MTHSHHNRRNTGSFPARIGALLGVLLVLGLLAAAPASALTLEQTGTFAGSVNPPAEPGVFPEEVQLGGVSGMAVNVDGAGGVPAGTLYAAGRVDGENWVARYEPDGDSLKFVGAWQVLGAPGAYEQCGPGGPKCSARAESSASPIDVDVDQTTGNVYVFNGVIAEAGFMLVTAFSPDGSEEITRFGEKAADGKKTAETPSQIHDLASIPPGGIAVDDAGAVYVFDVNQPDNFYHRLMVFKPKTPGNYEEYEYAGQDEDIGAGFAGQTKYPSRPVTDAAGDIYVAGEDYVQKYDPDQPAAPICSFDFNKSGITAITVDPESGAPFFYTYKDKKVHQLSPCNGEGEFVETGPLITVAPERAYLSAFAFDPKRQLTSRPAGVLYGGAPSALPGIGPGQPGRGSLGYIFAPLKESPPVVVEESVAHVTETGAELRTEINPKGFETRYAFQYLTEAAYQEAGESFAGASEAPPGGAVLGAGQAAIAAATSLSGLKADTKYVYRAVATSNCSPAEPSKVCEVLGHAQSFRTFPFESPGLPDNRAYELVSPTEKNGGQVMPADPTISSCGQFECKPGSAYQHFPMQSTADGEAIVYEGTPFDEQGAVIENQYIAHRDPKVGWQTTNLTPPLLNSKEGQGYKAFNPELSEGLLGQVAPSLSSDAPLDYTNLYRQPTGDPLSLDPLLTEAPPNRPPGNGAVRLKLTYAGGSTDLSRLFFEANDALTPDALDGGVSKNNLYEWSGGQLRLVNLLPGDSETVLGAVFGSGALLKSGDINNPAPVFSHAISDDGSRVFWSSEAGQAYVRIDGVETRKIEDSGKFLTASPDGSKLLLDDGCLYDVQEEACEDLTQGKGGFEGIAGQSEDLSHVYFVDTEVLDEAPNIEGDVAEAGKFNLYAWVEGATSFVATLLPADNEDKNGGAGDWQSSPSVRTAQASSGGRFVAFLSSAPLTGYDNVGPCKSDNKGGFIDGPCPEAFLYDSATGELRCVSCNPSNARPLGRTVFRSIFEAPDSLPQPRYLTDSGRLYFDSQDSLVPADTNDGVEDVYQYEPEGIGSCKRASGCVSLISAGREAADSNLLAIDATGKSVFFTTRDRLRQKDKDELIDLYVAREGGGIASETETTRSECQGESCQPAALVPNDPTPGSSSFQGSGNVKQAASKPRCPKGRRQVQRKGKPRCVKRKRARAANRKRGGAK